MGSRSVVIAAVTMSLVAAMLSACQHDGALPAVPAGAGSPTVPAGAGSVAATMVQCLNDQGWETRAVSDDEWETVTGISRSQVNEYEAAVARCEDRFGYDEPERPASRAVAERQYEMLLQVAECVRQLGFPAGEPPGKDSYIAMLMSSQVPSWHPYDKVYRDADSLDMIERVQRECPVR